MRVNNDIGQPGANQMAHQTAESRDMRLRSTMFRLPGARSEREPGGGWTWLLVLLLALTAGSPAAWAFDVDGFKSRLDATLAEVNTKSLTNSKATLARLDEMVAIGTVGAKEYAAKEPRFAKLMDAVVADAPAMKNYTDAEIEDKWGEKGTGGDAAGVPLKSLGQFDATRAAIELIVGPSHAYIFIKKWESAQRARWLEQARDELTELKEHLKEVH